MFGGPKAPMARGTPALITGLTILALGAMAAAIPPARLTPNVAGVERGYVVSSASFSDMLAEILNGNGYTFMAIDFTKVPLRGGEVWRGQFDGVSRIFPVWGWVDVRPGVGQATQVAASLSLSGLLLYGAKPEDVEAVRASKPGLKVVPVVRFGETWRGTGDAATAFPAGKLAEAAKARMPVLLAEGMDQAKLLAARAALPGDYVVCSIAILD